MSSGIVGDNAEFVRILRVWVAPFILVVTASLYAVGEFLNMRDAHLEGSRNGWLFAGAVLWVIGQILYMTAVVSSEK